MNVRKVLKNAGILLAAAGLMGITACDSKPTETPFPQLKPSVTITGIQISGGVTRIFASGADEDGQVTSYIFTVDAGAPDTLVTPVLDADITYASMDEQHAATVVAIDNDGISSDPAQISFTPNSVGAANKAPDTEILAPAAGAVTSEGIVIEWGARDPDGSLTGYQYRIDDDTWTDVALGTTRATATGLTVGSHVIQVRAKDNFNVWDPTPATVAISVRAGLQPELSTTGVTDGATFFVAPGATVDLTVGWAGEAGWYDGDIATYSYSLNGATPTVTTEAEFTFVGLIEGAYTIDVTCTDIAGNTQSTSITFGITVPSLTKEVLVVNGVDWGTYGPNGAAQLDNTYPVYFGTDNADTWDYWEIMGGAPDYAAYGMDVNVVGTGTPTGADLGEYKCVLWMGQHYLGDLDSWNAALMAGYVNAGGKLYFFGRRGSSFFGGTELQDMAGITGMDADGTTTGYSLTAAGSALGLQPAAILTTSFGNGITGIVDSPDVEAIFTDPGDATLITGLRAKSPGSSDWNIVIVVGRNYRADPPAAMAENILKLLRDTLGIDPPGSF